jgi:hypothetical protein
MFPASPTNKEKQMPRDVFDWSHSDATAFRSVAIRILVVIDGRIRLSKHPQYFGLGYVLDTLRALFAPWVRFSVDVARHDDEVREDASLLAYPRAFKFTDSDFDLDASDQVWFFADTPNDRTARKAS